jgi:hypothetical protein
MRNILGPLSPRRSASQPFSLRVALALAMLVSCSGWAFAGFNSNGLETFDGTNVDTSTWRLTNPQWISQNNAAFISMSTSTNPATPTQLTTTSIALGLSSSAEIQATFTAHTPVSNYSQFVYLALTTADSPHGWDLFDSYAVSAELDFGPFGSGFIANYYSGGGGNGNGHVYTTTLNTLYSLRLERLSDTGVRYTLYDSANSILYQYLRTLPSYTGPLYVAFGADSVDATFDNLQLSGNIVPEPSASALLGVAAAAALWRRKKTGPVRSKVNSPGASA